MDRSIVGTVSHAIVELTEPMPAIDLGWTFTVRKTSRGEVSFTTFSFPTEAEAEEARRMMLLVVDRAIAIR